MDLPASLVYDGGSEIEQDPEAILDLGHRVRGDAAPPAKQALDREDTQLITQDQ